MATRLYVEGPNIGSFPTPFSWSAGWNKTTGAVSSAMQKGKYSFAATNLDLTGVGVSGQYTATRRGVSPALAYDQTISGSLKGQFRCGQSVATDNYTIACAVKVIKPDGTDRGVLLAVTASDDTSTTPPEFSTADTNRALRDSAESASISLSAVDALAGDLIVFETGFRQASTSVEIGDVVVTTNSATDLPEDDTTTAANNSWIEFSQDIAFAVSIAPTSNPAGVASVTTTTTYAAAPIAAAAADRIVAIVITKEFATVVPTGVTIDGSAMIAGPRTTFNSMGAWIYYLPWPSGTTATFVITWDGTGPGNTANHVTIYGVTGADAVLQASGTDTSDDMDVSDPVTTGSQTIPTGGGFLAVAGCAADANVKAWANATENIDADAGTFRHTTAVRLVPGTATITCTGTIASEDGALAWVIFKQPSSIVNMPPMLPPVKLN